MNQIACDCDCFLSFYRGKDLIGRKNEERIAKLCVELKNRNLILCSEYAKDQKKNIDRSQCVLVFITEEYIKKANGDRGANDEIKIEFEYSLNAKSRVLMIPIAMDAVCKNKEAWRGPVSLLSNTIPVNFQDDSLLKSAADELYRQITKRIIPLHGVIMPPKLPAPPQTVKELLLGDASKSVSSTYHVGASVPYEVVDEVVESKLSTGEGCRHFMRECRIMQCVSDTHGCIAWNAEEVTVRFSAPAFVTAAKKAAMMAKNAPSRHVQVYPDGEYEGQFESFFEKREGYGVFSRKDGAVYSGEFQNDKIHGMGVITFATGEVYEGEWKDGKKSGFGYMRAPGGWTYEGEFFDGSRHGHGVLKYLSVPSSNSFILTLMSPLS